MTQLTLLLDVLLIARLLYLDGHVSPQVPPQLVPLPVGTLFIFLKQKDVMTEIQLEAMDAAQHVLLRQTGNAQQ